MARLYTTAHAYNAAVSPRRGNLQLAALVLGAALALVAPPAHAGNATQVWRTVESRHFEVHYPEPLGALARKVALAAERVHATLSAALRNVGLSLCRPCSRRHGR